MVEQYHITYQTENQYEYPVIEASWQFLIIPEESESQSKPEISFWNSEQTPWEVSQNGFGFPVIRIRNRHRLQQIHFKASFSLTKVIKNPFEFNLNQVVDISPEGLKDLGFRMRFDQFLKLTRLTRLPENSCPFTFDWSQSFFENLKSLNHWVYAEIKYTPGLTHVNTLLSEILELKKGVCQDFAHLYIGICRSQGIPARYVSGYLHQGLGFFGDAQMHAWVEAYLPEVGWIGFDPTNDILASADHIKVAHGRDYEDCAPIKGVVYGPGTNLSIQKVQVVSQQQ
jgi:transglutaminase-like putative cysteine protease